MRGMTKWAREQLPSTVDTLVGTGMSGTLIVPRLAERLGLFWGVVRKPGVSSHAGSTTRYEGQMGRRWAFVDDFISSGDTMFRVLDEVEGEFANPDPGRYPWKAHWHTEFAGALCYSNWSGSYSTPFKGLWGLEAGFVGSRRDRILKIIDRSEGPGVGRLQAVPSEAVPSTPSPAPGESPSQAPVPYFLFRVP